MVAQVEVVAVEGRRGWTRQAVEVKEVKEVEVVAQVEVVGGVGEDGGWGKKWDGLQAEAAAGHHHGSACAAVKAQVAVELSLASAAVAPCCVEDWETEALPKLSHEW